MDKAKAGYLEGVVSVLVNNALFILKLWAGIVTGSIALIADAWHTLSDSLSSVIVIVSVKLSSLGPDREHPFGHGRWEQIAALLIGFLLAVIGLDFLKNSVLQFYSRKSTNFGTLAVVATVISIVTKEALAQYAFYMWRRTGSLTIKADGWHHRTDALSSVVVLVGIAISSTFWWIDSVLGMIISLMIFHAAYGISREAVAGLLGETPPADLISSIENEIKNVYAGSIYPHHYHIHNYVTHKELTFHIKIDGDLTVFEGHQIATDIENRIFTISGIIATIHIEPDSFEHKSD